MIFEYLLTGFALAITTAILYFKYAFSYWKKRDVAYIPPTIPMGNLENPLSLKKGFNGVLLEAHRVFKAQGKRFGGVFMLHKPVLLLIDPDLIKRIMTTDFQYFMNHGNFIDEKKEPLSANLLNLEGEKWKNLRTKLSPTFTSGKMKMMYNQIMTSAEQMVEHIGNLQVQNEALDMKEIANCYSTDVIGSCAFGLDCNSFKNPDAAFRKYGRIVTELDFVSALRTFLTFVIPEAKKIFPIRTFRKDAEDFFANAFKEVIEQRQSTDFKRNDFIQILLELGSSHGPKANGLTMEQMLAQSLIFFGAALETSAINLSFCLYELAFHQDVQDKLRKEILEGIERNNGALTYEVLMEMKYMDQVIDESLRKYPPIPFLNRKCNKDYVIPGSNLKIENGTSVMVCALGLHMDPEYFPDPERFDPDRFSKENKHNIHPFTFLPFGDGPRICIGQRFALLENKIALALILKRFRILPHKDTPKYIQLNPRSIATVSAKRLLLKTESL